MRVLSGNTWRVQEKYDNFITLTDNIYILHKIFMKRLLTILTVLILPFSAMGQHVIDLGDDMDVFIFQSGHDIIFRAAKKLDNGRTKVVKVVFSDDKDYYKIETDTVKAYSSSWFWIGTDSVKSMTMDEWNELLLNKSIILDRDSNSICTLNTHNTYLMSIAEYIYDKVMHDRPLRKLSIGRFAYNDRFVEPYGYCYIKVARDKYVLVLLRFELYRSYFKELIIPFEDGLQVLNYRADYSDCYPLADIEDKDRYFEDLWAEEFYRVKKDGDQDLLTDRFGTLLSVKADSIRVYENYIITYDCKQERYTLYDLHLKKLPVKNIRSIVPDNYQLLIGNKVKWLQQGKAVDKRIIRAQGWLDRPTRYNLSVSKENDCRFTLHSGESKFASVMKENSCDIDSVFLIDRQLHLSAVRYLSQGRLDINTLFVKKKNGKYNICTYELDREDMTFTLIPMLDYDVDYVDMNEPYRFYHEGRVGCYPYMRTAAYKEIIEVKDYFIRFRDMKGKKGWHNTKEQRVYYD